MIPLRLFSTVFILYTVHEAVARFPRGGQLARRHWLWLVRRLDVILPPQLIPGTGAKLNITRRLVKNWQSWRFPWCEAFLQASKTTTARVAAACWVLVQKWPSRLILGFMRRCGPRYASRRGRSILHACARFICWKMKWNEEGQNVWFVPLPNQWRACLDEFAFCVFAFLQENV